MPIILLILQRVHVKANKVGATHHELVPFHVFHWALHGGTTNYSRQVNKARIIRHGCNHCHVLPCLGPSHNLLFDAAQASQDLGADPKQD